MERMSWLSKLHPRAAGHRASRAPSLQSPAPADPETCLMVFKNHWYQVLRVLEKRGPLPGPGAADDLSAVRNNTYQLVTLLAEERPRAGGAPGPILELVAAEQLLERLLRWHRQRDFGEEQRAEQLKLYEMLVSQSQQPLLRHPAVLQPLLQLLSLCAEPGSPALRAGLVLLLSQLCACVAREPALLERFFHRPGPGAPARLLLFSLLVPFLHHEGTTGQQARDALLLLLALAGAHPPVAAYVAERSYFCPVLATGLSALYSSLPRKIEVRADDWHCLRREDWTGVPALVLFMNSLEFCNAVLQVAPPVVRKQLVDYVHNGFLVPVMGPACIR
ncbi:LOW QUALITY PROTEIN: FHF complex subunit HOOK-interacting protein 1B-like [Pelodiscus sinensis]|uniref:LOW QUALITY PROTEIN: FHF complex subunit HOOK-interacting protein 1B-like n=1 Tax=Pelodiscus sinensis TaxID=13735 RepID=UPI003F6BDB06